MCQYVSPCILDVVCLCQHVPVGLSVSVCQRVTGIHLCQCVNVSSWQFVCRRCPHVHVFIASAKVLSASNNHRGEFREVILSIAPGRSWRVDHICSSEERPQSPLSTRLTGAAGVGGLGTGYRTVDSGQWTVDSGQWTAMSRGCVQFHRPSPPGPAIHCHTTDSTLKGA